MIRSLSPRLDALHSGRALGRKGRSFVQVQMAVDREKGLTDGAIHHVLCWLLAPTRQMDGEGLEDC